MSLRAELERKEISEESGGQALRATIAVWDGVVLRRRHQIVIPLARPGVSTESVQATVDAEKARIIREVETASPIDLSAIS